MKLKCHICGKEREDEWDEGDEDGFEDWEEGGD